MSATERRWLLAEEPLQDQPDDALPDPGINRNRPITFVPGVPANHRTRCIARRAAGKCSSRSATAVGFGIARNIPMSRSTGGHLDEARAALRSYLHMIRVSVKFRSS